MRKSKPQRHGPVPHHMIVSIEVTGGFHDGTKLEFTDGLNVIIGARGTGKTTILEFIRYALGLMPDPSVSPDRARRLERLLKKNLGSGKIRLVVRTKHGATYTVERRLNEPARILDERGVPVSVSLDRDLLFKAELYGRHEIEEIAGSLALQLALLDRFVDEKVRVLTAEIQNLEQELAQNKGALLALGRDTSGVAEARSEAAVLAERLKGFELKGGLDAARINTAHAHRSLRVKEARALEEIRAELKRALIAAETLWDSAIRRLESRLDREILEGPNKEVFESLAARTRSLATTLLDSLKRTKADIDATDRALGDHARALAERHALQEQAYGDTIAKSEEAREQAAERTELQARHLEVTRAIETLALKGQDYESQRERRRELVARLTAAREERFRLRRDVAALLTNALEGTVRVTVKQAADDDRFLSLLNEALKGSKMQYAALTEKIVKNVGPQELVHLVSEASKEQGSEGVDPLQKLADRAGFDRPRAQKIVEALKNNEALYEIEAIQLEDVPRIELFDESDYKDAADLSSGGVSATILPILLLENDRPLGVDQPEDDLDNAFIFDAVVKILRDTKTRRQLIFVTHNANIPVLGDAERVFELASDGKHAVLRSFGTVDEMKEVILRRLEGGRAAFAERRARYAR